MNRRDHSATQRLVDEAVRQWHSAGAPERLSEAARTRILSGAGEPERLRERAHRPLFLPARAVWAYGALSLVLGAFLLTQLRAPDAARRTPRVEFSKQDGDVVIAIRNGDTDHVVYRSESPRDFARATPHRITDGIYTEDLSQDGDLVFYRIE